MSAPLPVPEAIVELLAMLLGKRPKVTRSAPLSAGAARGIATYVDAEARVVYAALVDVPFLASVGAALALIPPAVATEAVRAAKVSDALVENAYEVLNVAASVFNEIEGTTLYVKIRALDVGSPLPAESACLVAKPVGRLDLDVVVPGYPAGKLSLLVRRLNRSPDAHPRCRRRTAHAEDDRPCARARRP